ncbi:MAG: DUF4198 domain-containing protein [Verrucomicrobiae bacterium]|nr:DUF4198 domain-containing protein [Verrucomicrobiae bacterium]
MRPTPRWNLVRSRSVRAITPWLGLFLGALSAAQAHFLWIESETPTEAKVYYGEFAEGLREKAGAKLEERGACRVFLDRAQQPESPLSCSKMEDHFLARFQSANGWILVQDLEGEVKDWRKHSLGIVKPVYYARAAVANRASAPHAKMTLDILPEANALQRLQVLFRDKPLPGAKVAVYAPNSWMRELRTDSEGRVTISTPWSGRYVVEVIHKENRRGEWRGKAYEAIRHRATFSHVY